MQILNKEEVVLFRELRERLKSIPGSVDCIGEDFETNGIGAYLAALITKNGRMYDLTICKNLENGDLYILNSGKMRDC